MPDCPHCDQTLTPFRIYNRSALRCLRCRKAQLSATLFEWMLDPALLERLPAIVNRSREEPGKGCPSCGAPLGRIDDPFSASVCKRCLSIWIEERKIATLPLRAKEELLEEAGRSEGHDRALASEKGPDDPLVDFVSSQMGLPFVENVPLIKIRPRVTLTTMFFILLLTRTAWHDPLLGSALCLQASLPLRFSGANLITYFFIQPDSFQFFTNLYFLWLFGAQVEQLVGPIWLILLLALSSISGGLLHASLFHIPLSGAGAGVAGLGMFFALAFPHARMGLPILGSWMRFNSWMWILVWSAMQVLVFLWYFRDLPTEFTLYAPLGGAAAGFLLWALGLWRKTQSAPKN